MNTDPATKSYRDIGDVSFDLWDKELRDWKSPLLPWSRELYEIVRPHSALALAQLHYESKYDTVRSRLSALDRNPTNMKHWPEDPRGKPAGMTGTKPVGNNQGDYLTFTDYPSAIREWRRRVIDDADYKGGVYRPTMTLKEYCETYADITEVHPDSGKDTSDIYPEVRSKLMSLGMWKESAMATYPVALGGGKTATIESIVPIRQAILPANMTRVRPGYKMVARAWCQHENGNPRHKADDERRYFHQGAEGRQAGYHFVGDDTEIIQLIPLNENAWHAGDNLGPGNMASVAGSIAQGANNMAKARNAMEHLAAGVMVALGIPADKTRQHYDFAPNRKDCPQWIRRDGYWPTFQANVKRLHAALAGGGQPTPVEYATPVQIAALDIASGVPPAKLTLDDGSLAIYVGDRVRATKATPRLQRSSVDAPHIGEVIPEGTEFDVDWLIQTKPGEPWFYYTPWDTRVIADDTERISDAKAA